MKIQKLKPDLAGRYNFEEVPAKINEIIELLNNSFITREHDEAIVDITCDTIVPKSNEHTLNNKVCKESENLSDSFNINTPAIEAICDTVEDNLINKIKSNPWSDKKCPNCGASYFSVGPSYTTAVYYPPIYKDGVNINPGKNRTITKYFCYSCEHRWEETE